MRSLYAAGILVLSALTLAWAGAGGTPKKEDVPKYLKMLKASQSGKDRALAAQMLGKRGAIKASDVEEAVEPLKTALQKDVDAKVRAAAATALGDISPEPEKTVPLLVDALKDKNLDVKLAVIGALGQYSAMAKEAIPSLREIAKDKTDKKLSMSAMAAIKSIAGKKK